MDDDVENEMSSLTTLLAGVATNLGAGSIQLKRKICKQFRMFKKLAYFEGLICKARPLLIRLIYVGCLNGFNSLKCI